MCGVRLPREKVSEPARRPHTVPRAPRNALARASRRLARRPERRQPPPAPASASGLARRPLPVAETHRRHVSPPTARFAFAMADGNDRNWNALLKWSLAQTHDGNTANVRDDGAGDAAAPRAISEVDIAWFTQAMQTASLVGSAEIMPTSSSQHSNSLARPTMPTVSSDVT